jgi:methyl-accepting chemotaxis protein
MKNLKIRLKLLIAFGTMMLGLAIFTAVVLVNFSNVVDQNSYIVKEQMAKRHMMFHLREGQEKMGMGLRGILNPRVFAKEDLFLKHQKLFNDGRTIWKENFEEMEAMSKDKEELQLWNEYKKLSDEWNNDYDQFLLLLDQKIGFKKEGVALIDERMVKLDDDLFTQFTVIYEHYQPISAKLDQMLDDLEVDIDETVSSVENLESNTKTVVIVLFLICLIVSSIFTLWISNQISKGINHIKDNMQKAEKGDLRAKCTISSRDEIGELSKAFNSLLDKTARTIRQIKETSGVLSHSSEKLLTIAEGMAANNEETYAKASVVATSVEEIAAEMMASSNNLSSTSSNIVMIASSVEEMSGTIRNLAAASEQTSAGVRHAANLVGNITGSIVNVANSSNQASGAVNSVVHALKEIDISLNEVNKNCSKSIQITADAGQKAKSTNEIIAKLSASSKQIGKIVEVINNIAEQTNMLALNAAIEAAGAGESGKGFAVVANEVKELAKQTAEATDEISDQIESMQSGISRAVLSVSDINKVIEEITGITNTIASAVTEQSATTGEISKAATRAAENVNQISKEINEVSGNAKNVARSVEESTNGVMDIAKSANELSQASSEVAHNSERASNTVSQVSRSSSEISSSTTDIAKNIQEINTVTLDAAENSMKTNESARELTEIAKELEQLVGQFQI